MIAVSGSACNHSLIDVMWPCGHIVIKQVVKFHYSRPLSPAVVPSAPESVAASCSPPTTSSHLDSRWSVTALEVAAAATASASAVALEVLVLALAVVALAPVLALAAPKLALMLAVAALKLALVLAPLLQLAPALVRSVNNTNIGNIIIVSPSTINCL